MKQRDKIRTRPTVSRKRTNGDVIRAMSNEELVKILTEASCCFCSLGEYDCADTACSVGVYRWLNQESEE